MFSGIKSMQKGKVDSAVIECLKDSAIDNSQPQGGNRWRKIPLLASG